MTDSQPELGPDEGLDDPLDDIEPQPGSEADDPDDVDQAWNESEAAEGGAPSG